MNFHVYILKCADNSYYTGHTDDLEKRLSQHRQQYFKSCYTATRLPVKLVFCQEFATREEALASERQIKGWSRKKKEAMMRGDWNEVSRLAQNTLRPFDKLSAQGDRSSLNQGDRNPVSGEHRQSSVRGEPVEPQVQNIRNKSIHGERRQSPVHGEPVEPEACNENNKKNGEA